MINEKKNVFDDITVTPSECISHMFEQTQDDGILIMPMWAFSDEVEGDTKFAEIKMNWNKTDCESLISEYETLYRHILAISKVCDSVNELNESAIVALSLEELGTWEKYVKPISPVGMNKEKMNEICEKLYNEDELSDEEWDYYDKYSAASGKEAKKRLGKDIASSLLISRARRLCKLMSLDAPAIVIKNEARYLAQVLAVNKYAEYFSRKDAI